MVTALLDTVLKRPIADAGHGVGDGYTRQAGAVVERIIADAGHLSSSIHIGYLIWDDHYARISTTISVCHLQLRIIIDIIIIDGDAIFILNSEVIGEGFGACHAEEQGEEGDAPESVFLRHWVKF